MRKKSFIFTLYILGVAAGSLSVLSSCGKKENVSDYKNVITSQQVLDDHDRPTDFFFIQDTVNNLVGMATKEGKVVVEPKYIGLATYFFDDPDKTPIVRVISPDTLFGVVDFKGATLISANMENPIQIWKDRVTGDTYYSTYKTIEANKEYKVKLPGGDSRTLTDDRPRSLYGAFDASGKEVVPFKYDRIDLPIDGYFKVSREIDLAGSTLEGIVKDGKNVLDPDYNRVKIESSGKGAVARIRPKRDVNYTETYLIDFKNGNKKTKFYCDSWGDGEISKGWVVRNVKTKNERGNNITVKEYFDFSGNPVNLDEE